MSQYLPPPTTMPSSSYSVVSVILEMMARGGDDCGGESSSEEEEQEEDNDFASFMPPPPSNNKKDGFPAVGGGGTIQPPDKGQLYSNDELWDLLQVHQGLTEEMGQRQQQQPREETKSVMLPGEAELETGVPSLHDLVMQTVSEIDDDTNKKSNDENDNDNVNIMSTIMPPPKNEIIDDIIAIACDVDGTLLTSSQTLHPRTETAIRRAVEQVQQQQQQQQQQTKNNNNNLQFFFPATGKTRKGALDSLGPDIGGLLSKLPGVFIQGLYCIDGDGDVVFEQKLTADAIQNAETLGAECGVTLLAYDGDNLYSNVDGDPELIAEIHDKWGEPKPTVIPSLVRDHSNGYHKILFVHQDAEMLTTRARPKLQALADNNDASVTQAIPTMLELIPRGCSKALGVEKLCQALGIDPTKQLLAIGDAENDVGMLQLASIGVAVNNACEMAKESADFIMPENNDDGGAGAAMERFSPLRLVGRR